MSAHTGGGGGAGGGESRLAKLRIMSKEVTIACRPGEEDALKQAAAYIDAAMRELRSRNSTSSIEKIAIVTAINTADALLKAREGGARPADGTGVGADTGAPVGADTAANDGADRGDRTADAGEPRRGRDARPVEAHADASDPLRERIAGMRARVDALLDEHAPTTSRTAEAASTGGLES